MASREAEDNDAPSSNPKEVNSLDPPPDADQSQGKQQPSIPSSSPGNNPKNISPAQARPVQEKKRGANNDYSNEEERLQNEKGAETTTRSVVKNDEPEDKASSTGKTRCESEKQDDKRKASEIEEDAKPKNDVSKNKKSSLAKEGCEKAGVKSSPEQTRCESKNQDDKKPMASGVSDSEPKNHDSSNQSSQGKDGSESVIEGHSKSSETLETLQQDSQSHDKAAPGHSRWESEKQDDKATKSEIEEESEDTTPFPKQTRCETEEKDTETSKDGKYVPQDNAPEKKSETTTESKKEGVTHTSKQVVTLPQDESKDEPSPKQISSASEKQDDKPMSSEIHDSTPKNHDSSNESSPIKERCTQLENKSPPKQSQSKSEKQDDKPMSPEIEDSEPKNNDSSNILSSPGQTRSEIEGNCKNSEQVETLAQDDKSSSGKTRCESEKQDDKRTKSEIEGSIPEIEDSKDKSPLEKNRRQSETEGHIKNSEQVEALPHDKKSDDKASRDQYRRESKKHGHKSSKPETQESLQENDASNECQFSTKKANHVENENESCKQCANIEIHNKLKNEPVELSESIQQNHKKHNRTTNSQNSKPDSYPKPSADTEKESKATTSIISRESTDDTETDSKDKSHTLSQHTQKSERFFGINGHADFNYSTDNVKESVTETSQQTRTIQTDFGKKKSSEKANFACLAKNDSREKTILHSAPNINAGTEIGLCQKSKNDRITQNKAPAFIEDNAQTNSKENEPLKSHQIEIDEIKDQTKPDSDENDLVVTSTSTSQHRLSIKSSTETNHTSAQYNDLKTDSKENRPQDSHPKQTSAIETETSAKEVGVISKENFANKNESKPQSSVNQNEKFSTIDEPETDSKEKKSSVSLIKSLDERGTNDSTPDYTEIDHNGAKTDKKSVNKMLSDSHTKIANNVHHRNRENSQINSESKNITDTNKKINSKDKVAKTLQSASDANFVAEKDTDPPKKPIVEKKEKEKNEHKYSSNESTRMDSNSAFKGCASELHLISNSREVTGATLDASKKSPKKRSGASGEQSSTHLAKCSKSNLKSKSILGTSLFEDDTKGKETCPNTKTKSPEKEHRIDTIENLRQKENSGDISKPANKFHSSQLGDKSKSLLPNLNCKKTDLFHGLGPDGGNTPDNESLRNVKKEITEELILQEKRNNEKTGRAHLEKCQSADDPKSIMNEVSKKRSLSDSKEEDLTHKVSKRKSGNCSKDENVQEVTLCEAKSPLKPYSSNKGQPKELSKSLNADDTIVKYEAETLSKSNVFHLNNFNCKNSDIKIPPTSQIQSSEKKSKNPQIKKRKRNHFESTEDIKLALYLEGTKIHRGKGAERLFSDYWDSLGRYIVAGIGRNIRRSRCCDAMPNASVEPLLRAFLKTRKLRKLHNKLVLSIMTRCYKEKISKSIFEPHIPHQWSQKVKHRVQNDTLCSSQSTKHLNQVRHNELDCLQLIDNQNHVIKRDLDDSKRNMKLFEENFDSKSWIWTVLGNSTTRSHVCHETNSLSQTSMVEQRNRKSQVENNYPSLNLPGTLSVDLQARRLTQREGLTVSDAAISLLTVAVREYSNLILSRTVTGMDELSKTHFPVFQKLNAESTNFQLDPCVSELRGHLKHDRVPLFENNSESKKRRLISSIDIAYAISSNPNLCGNSKKSSSFTRMSWERVLFDGVKSSSYPAVQSPMLMNQLILGGDHKKENVINEINIHIKQSLGKTDSGVSQNISKAENKKEENISVIGQRPPSSKGLGRGAKNLSQMMARAKACTSRPSSANNSSQSPITSTDTTQNDLNKDGEKTRESQSENISRPDSSQSITRGSAGNVGRNNSISGRGIGVKNLAALKKRPSVTDSAASTHGENSSTAKIVTSNDKEKPQTKPVTEIKNENTLDKSKAKPETKVAPGRGLGGKQLMMLRQAEEKRKLEGSK